jgi:hypothetical protein
MTDRQWQKSSSLWSLLNALRYEVPCRKILLFTAAVVRGFKGSGRKKGGTSRFEEIANALERYAEGQDTYADFEQARAGLMRMRKDPGTAHQCRSYLNWSGNFPMFDPAECASWPETSPELCDLLREVVGNPFRTTQVDQQWLAWNQKTVATLARAIRSEKKFDLMPLLGDALEDAGCTDPTILAHCRDSRPHVTGCWVIDLLTAEEEPRRSLEDTWKYLDKQGHSMPWTRDRKPFVPPRKPRYDDKVLGFSFFRCVLEDADLSNTTVPRTYFGRSLLERIAFRNTDLSQSVMCWNDFIDCDLSRADLTRSDIRSATFQRCLFVGADLRWADLRGSAFEGCDFTGANLRGAKADEEFGHEWELIGRLSEKQRKGMKWYEDPGPDPDGG